MVSVGDRYAELNRIQDRPDRQFEIINFDNNYARIKIIGPPGLDGVGVGNLGWIPLHLLGTRNYPKL